MSHRNYIRAYQTYISEPDRMMALAPSADLTRQVCDAIRDASHNALRCIAADGAPAATCYWEEEDAREVLCAVSLSFPGAVIEHRWWDMETPPDKADADSGVAWYLDGEQVGRGKAEVRYDTFPGGRA